MLMVKEIILIRQKIELFNLDTVNIMLEYRNYSGTGGL